MPPALGWRMGLLATVRPAVSLEDGGVDGLGGDDARLVIVRPRLGLDAQNTHGHLPLRRNDVPIGVAERRAVLDACELVPGEDLRAREFEVVVFE